MTDQEWRAYVAGLTAQTFDPRIFGQNVMLRLRRIVLERVEALGKRIDSAHNRLDTQGQKRAEDRRDIDTLLAHVERLEQQIIALEDAQVALALTFDQHKARKERACGE